MPAWSEEEDARLKALLAEGHSYSDCATLLAAEGFPPRSRHAHIGRAHRQGLAPAPLPQDVAQVKATREQLKRGRNLRSVLAAGNAAGRGRKVPSSRHSPPQGEGARPGRQARQFNPVFGRGAKVPKPPCPAAPGDAPAGAPLVRTAVRFLDRTERQCGYPVLFDGVPIAEKLVCGAPKALDVPYCQTCMGIAYQPATRSREVAA